MRVAVTGVPGTGKTILAKKIARKINAKLVRVNDLVKEKKLFNKTEKDGTRVVNLKKLERELEKIFERERKKLLELEQEKNLERKKTLERGQGKKLARRTRALERKKQQNVVVEGHLVCELKLKVDRVVVLRTNPRVLEKRLKKRGYAKEKIEENVLAEMLDYCTVASERNLKKARIYEVETSGSVKENLQKITKIIEGKGERLRAGWVSWGKELSERV